MLMIFAAQGVQAMDLEGSSAHDEAMVGGAMSPEASHTLQIVYDLDGMQHAIFANSEQLFMLKNGKMIPAKKLTAGMEILTSSGEVAVIRLVAPAPTR